MNLSKDINISPVKKYHINEIIDLLQDVSKYKPSYDFVLKNWKAFSNQSNYSGLVALNKNKVVGYGSIFFITKIRGGKMAQIDEISIHRDFRLRGIGRLILNSLFDLAVNNKCYKVCLTCKENNVKFYEKQNFDLAGFHLNKNIYTD